MSQTFRLTENQMKEIYTDMERRLANYLEKFSSNVKGNYSISSNFLDKLKFNISDEVELTDIESRIHDFFKKRVFLFKSLELRVYELQRSQSFLIQITVDYYIPKS